MSLGGGVPLEQRVPEKERAGKREYRGHNPVRFEDLCHVVCVFFFSSSQISLKKPSPGPPLSNQTRFKLHRLPLFFYLEPCYGILFNLFNLTTSNAMDVMPPYPLIQDGVRAFAPFFSPATSAPLELTPVLSPSRGICKCLQEASVTLFLNLKVRLNLNLRE